MFERDLHGKITKERIAICQLHITPVSWFELT